MTPSSLTTLLPYFLLIHGEWNASTALAGVGNLTTTSPPTHPRQVEDDSPWEFGTSVSLHCVCLQQFSLCLNAVIIPSSTSIQIPLCPRRAAIFVLSCSTNLKKHTITARWRLGIESATRGVLILVDCLFPTSQIISQNVSFPPISTPPARRLPPKSR